MEKESVKKFDLEAAFKALDEIDIPEAKGIKANRVDLRERFGHKPATETLVEDYYDVSSTEDLEEAKEEREGEVAQAKLARIEKIVDLDAETADDLLPSYVGKVIMQCPQCMTLFYKNPEDIEHSEENPDIVNLNEPCQHCGNTSGYTLIGKVDAVSEDESDKYEEPTESEENELDLDFEDIPEESAEEEASEETSEEAPEDELDLDLDLDLEEIPEEDEKKEESLNLSKETSEEDTEHKSENLTLNEEIDKDLDKKLKDHNDYIEYLKNMIKQEEEALKSTDNEEVKAAIQRRLDAFNADLEAALPDALKTEVEPIEDPIVEEPVEEAPVEEQPTEAQAEEEAPVEEQLTEEASGEEPEECKVVLSDKPEKEVFAGTKEECEKIIEKNKETETAKEHGLEIVEPVEESLNVSEEAPSEHESEEKSENLTLNEGAEAEIDSIIASWGLNENLTEEGNLDKLLDSKEFETPVSKEEIDAAREESKEEPKEESLEECTKQQLTEEPEDTAKEIVDSWKEEEPVEEDINITNNDSPSRVDNRDQSGAEKTEEGLGSAISELGKDIPIVGPLLASDEAEKKDIDEGVGLFGIGDVNVNLDASGQNNAVGVGGGEGKTEGLIPDGLPTPPGLPGLPGLTEEAEEEPVEEPEEEKAEEPTPIETTVEEVKEVATEVAEEVLEETSEEDTNKEVEEKIEEVVDEVVEEKLGEEKPEEGEAEEVEETEEEQEFDFDDLQEESFNTHVKDFLTEVYENVSDFAATNCELKEGKLFVEGKISFKSGKEKLTMFEFLPQYGDGKLFFEGFNKDFSEDKAFTLNCSLTEAKELITESFGYKYKINETLVEGLK